MWKYKYKLKIGKPWFSRDVTKIQTPKSQGLLRFYLHLAKDLLKINFCASFQRDSIFRFENIALSNFPSFLCVTLIWGPRRPSHMWPFTRKGGLWISPKTGKFFHGHSAWIGLFTAWIQNFTPCSLCGEFHCRRETSMPWKIEWKLSCREYSIGVTIFTPWNRLGWWKKLHTMKSYLMFFRVLRASSYEPSWPGWLGYRDEFCLGFIWEISARFPRWEKVKDPGDEFWRQIRETKQT